MKIKSKIILFSLFLTVIIVIGVFWWFSQNKKNIIPYENKDFQQNATSNVENLNINPLTGLTLSNDKVNNRPIAIMINNLHSGQPLLGVSEADIMYECPTEGGITRILGVFKDPSSVPAIGSVRSSRPYFISIAKGLDAIYFHLGGSTHAYEILKSGYIDSIDLIKGQFMWRD